MLTITGKKKPQTLFIIFAFQLCEVIYTALFLCEQQSIQPYHFLSLRLYSNNDLHPAHPRYAWMKVHFDVKFV